MCCEKLVTCEKFTQNTLFTTKTASGIPAYDFWFSGNFGNSTLDVISIDLSTFFIRFATFLVKQEVRTSH